MNYTSIEQSKHLLELGLKADSADMYWAVDANIVVAESYIIKTKYETQIPAYKGAIPCWSSDSLLELGRSIVPFPTDFNLIMYLEHGWYLEFRGYDKNGNHRLIHESYSLNIIDTCYDMIVWLLENHYLK